MKEKVSFLYSEVYRLLDDSERKIVLKGLCLGILRGYIRTQLAITSKVIWTEHPHSSSSGQKEIEERMWSAHDM